MGPRLAPLVRRHVTLVTRLEKMSADDCWLFRFRIISGWNLIPWRRRGRGVGDEVGGKVGGKVGGSSSGAGECSLTPLIRCRAPTGSQSREFRPELPSPATASGVVVTIPESRIHPH